MCLDLSEFAQYTHKLLLKANEQSEKELKTIFDHMESLLTEGDEATKDAAATCFLENIINLTTNDSPYLSFFISCLGKNSKQYCIDWNAFNGGGLIGLEKK